MIRVGILFHSQHFQSSALSATLRFKISYEPVNAEAQRNAEGAQSRIDGRLTSNPIPFPNNSQFSALSATLRLKNPPNQ